MRSRRLKRVARKPAYTARIGPLVHYVTYVGIFAHVAFIPLFAWLGVPFMAFFNVASVIAWVVARAANRRGNSNLAVALIGCEVVTHAVLAGLWLGWHSAFHYYIVALIPVLMFNDRWRTRTAIFSCVLVALLYVGLRIATWRGAWVNVEPTVLQWVQYENILIMLVAMVVISLFFRFASESTERRMEELAMTDALTGLPNRRKMREVLDKEASRVARGSNCAGLVIADIDKFKEINDTWGHEAGDRVLRGLALLLGSNLRAHDAIARWGGEEFLFLLPDTDLAQATALAERMRGAVENAKFADGRLSVTMTFGVAILGSKNNVEECLRNADCALYCGKGSGRNRVIVHEQPTGAPLSSQSDPLAQPV